MQSTSITLITGGSRGLGAAMALALARDNHDIVLTYREAATAADTVVAQIQALGRRALALPLDVADAAGFPAFVARLQAGLDAWGASRLDGLVNNAGAGAHASFAKTTPAQFDAMLAIHLKGPFFLTQALLPLLADGARVLNISSGLARFTVPGYGAYAVMKGAVEVLSRYQAKELAARGIRVNTLAPGAIATDFGGGAVRDNAELNRFVASVTALGRAGEAADIGGAAAALMRPGAGWITGQRVEASGGMFL
ncbi:SDR family NAD(P)-dependent oxidoreductase [Roseateles saccharophilus]|uniref:NAD(P)-dependent dehydrogenase (Short-subunit alcohol dehydrogenase family) n=1 Tax=Roseateles saccharophilus TaxID=304 RepID=A0A4R3VA73_ROSSA|nr:SDR family oxidoreductase [Roseateles saccharophilus]MDG0834963.1 SDR family oxidoreductase [Roseateles saccharophilus]TCV02137.1 NAD(P)-dependent dehydrogenase (short-subunit alcohol dehydrogenase family) [Roseateles saccharophilus]